MQLTDLEIRRAKPDPAGDYKMPDGKGLYLHVTAAGSKVFRYRYKISGKERLLTIGQYPKVTLADAREARDSARELIKSGLDPSAEKQKAEAEADEIETFDQIAKEWWDKKKVKWSEVHAGNVWKSLEDAAFPVIGKMAMDAIETTKILQEVLLPVENRGAVETAHRIRQRISEIFQYAMAGGRAKNDPAATVGKALAPVVRKKQPAVIALKPARKMLQKVEETPSTALTKLAHRLLALTVLRPGPFAQTPWQEWPAGIEDDPKAVWVVPAERMKLSVEQKNDDAFDFFIPLAPQARECIRLLRGLSSKSPFAFPNHRYNHRPMSENALNYLLHRAGYHGKHVPHGWRSTFSTVMNERDPRDFKLIDICLAHSGKGKVEGAYNRAAYIEHRRELMQAWADMLLEGMQPAAELLNGVYQQRDWHDI